MLSAGLQITPTLTLVRELGAGGMGSVWVADHLALQTQVVVKFMHAQLAADRDSLMRFTREAASAANVKSPHVAQVLDHGIAATGEPYIVMELLEGTDLAGHLEKHGLLPLPAVDHVVTQVCKALSRAHEKGIVHRDIKPQNIFLCNVGHDEIFVKVLDFGIAKAATAGIGAATRTGALMGTPYYMSPEQTIGAKQIDHRTDLWALGVVAFECMTGHRPFEAETVGGLAVAVCSGPMPVPSQVNPSLPPSVDAWFARACSRDMSQRFGSAREMADALHLLVTGNVSGGRFSMEVARTLPLQAPSVPEAPALAATTSAPMSTEEPAGVPPRSSTAGIIVVAAAGLLLLGGVAIFGLSYLKKPVEAAAPPQGIVEPALPPVVPVPSTAAAPTPSVTPSADPVVLAPVASAKPSVKPPVVTIAKPAAAAASSKPTTASSTKPAATAAKSDRFSID